MHLKELCKQGIIRNACLADLNRCQMKLISGIPKPSAHHGGKHIVMDYDLPRSLPLSIQHEQSWDAVFSHPDPQKVSHGLQQTSETCTKAFCPPPHSPHGALKASSAVGGRRFANDKNLNYPGQGAG